MNLERNDCFNFEILQFLRRHRADMSFPDKYGCSPMDYARRAGIEHLLPAKPKKQPSECASSEDELVTFMDDRFFYVEDWPEDNVNRKSTYNISRMFEEPLFQIHTVQPGDNFDSISSKYNVGVASLKSANGMDKLLPSSKQILIPISNKQTEPEPLLKKVGDYVKWMWN